MIFQRWFYHDNPNVKTITLPTPSKEERENFVKGPNFATFLQVIFMLKTMPILWINQMNLKNTR